MSFRHALLSIALAALLPALSPAQVLDQIKKPLDYSKQADVNGKTVTFGDLHFGTVSQSARTGSTTSPLSKGDLQLHRMELNEVNLKSVDMSAVPEPVLPQVNFSPKRAAADKVNDQGTRQSDQTRQKAPITDRQIRPLTPGGEEELKKQLNGVHP
ncbi:MAG: hypothetical protein ACLPT4_06740 [Verrucomicrobiia bacterium]